MNTSKYVFKLATMSHPVKKTILVWERTHMDDDKFGASQPMQDMAMIYKCDAFAMVDTRNNSYKVLKNRNKLEVFTVYFQYKGDIIERQVSYDCLYAMCHFVADNDMSFILNDENQLTEALLF